MSLFSDRNFFSCIYLFLGLSLVQSCGFQIWSHMVWGVIVYTNMYLSSSENYLWLTGKLFYQISYGLPSSSVQILNLMAKSIYLGVNFIFTIKYFYLHVNFLSNILWFAKLLRSNFKFNVKNTFVMSKFHIYYQIFLFNVNFLSNILWFAKLLRSNFKFTVKNTFLGSRFHIYNQIFLSIYKLFIKHPMVCQAPLFKF